MKGEERSWWLKSKRLLMWKRKLKREKLQDAGRGDGMLR
jgi:hypothetical protein